MNFRDGIYAIFAIQTGVDNAKVILFCFRYCDNPSFELAVRKAVEFWRLMEIAQRR
jgi:hypothetical protein